MHLQVNEGPRTHVLRLLLQPDDLSHVRIRLEDLIDLQRRPRVELFDANDRHVGRPRLASRRAMASWATLPDAMHHAGDETRILDPVVQHGLERTVLELRKGRTGLDGAQH